MGPAVQATPAISYAHSLAGRPPRDWEPLETHLNEVAALASQFSSAFGAAQWGHVLGLCHDLGKYSGEFQQYLLASADPDAGASDGVQGKVDHSTFGARCVADRVARHRGQLLAFCIAGHHAGLPNASSDEDATQRGTLLFRLNSELYKIPEVVTPHSDLKPEELRVPFRDIDDFGFQIAFFTRMIFSALIDADRLATESFCDHDRALERDVIRPSISELKSALDQFMTQKEANAAPTAVNRLRSEVLADCHSAATQSPGFFSLNVPTGGGKTYSALTFALDHALQHGLRRVIVAIPFTSIIEQTADAYREALGSIAPGAIVEHHSNLNPKHETRANQFGTENWDAPLVVTTNVQFFESLFASSTTLCRKLHRIARSVIVLDEAQTLPVDLLQPALAALKELVKHYGCSIVLCTATQPALEKRSDFSIGIDQVRSIVPEPERLFHALKRVQVRSIGKLGDAELVASLAKRQSALCIVNTRPQAARIFELLDSQIEDKNSCFHLSTWMCGQHRRDTLDQVRRILANGKPCRVVSTQLVEAGVDLDFATVYRAAAGFDSIAQAAGRCNREGLLLCGDVYVFETEELPPAGFLRDAAQTGKELIGKYPDPIAPDAIAAYFRLFYWSQSERWDKWKVLPQFTASPRDSWLSLQFREAASRFQMIRDAQLPVFIPYDRRAKKMLKQLLNRELPFVPQRAIQPYLVPVRDASLRKLQDGGAVVEHESGMWLLVDDSAYSQRRGLIVDAEQANRYLEVRDER